MWAVQLIQNNRLEKSKWNIIIINNRVWDFLYCLLAKRYSLLGFPSSFEDKNSSYMWFMDGGAITSHDVEAEPKSVPLTWPISWVK